MSADQQQTPERKEWMRLVVEGQTLWQQSGRNRLI
jgi:hypothetical protein